MNESWCLDIREKEYRIAAVVSKEYYVEPHHARTFSIFYDNLHGLCKNIDGLMPIVSEMSTFIETEAEKISDLEDVAGSLFLSGYFNRVSDVIRKYMDEFVVTKMREYKSSILENL